ncbi:hypothetical protein C8Q80DRAFT_1273781 [Daedaleopsis nitida]|nr:hypothetical protein C8Q80DRAFT_1273781 [Daedaleopsis nitida]
MDLVDDNTGFDDILMLIRRTCLDHNVNLNIPYRSQDPTILQQIKDEVLASVPFLRGFEDGWPITLYLKKELKPHNSYHANHVNEGQQRAHKHKRGKTTAGHIISGKGLRSKRIVIRSAMKNRAREVVSPPPQDIPDMSPPPSQSSDIAPLPTDATRSELQPQEVIDHLLSFSLPLADAERITALFDSLGIKDVQYLRVLAQMRSRDTWLDELRVNSKLSEIQVRVIREMLERVGTQEGASNVSDKNRNMVFSVSLVSPFLADEQVQVPSFIPQRLYDAGDGEVTLQTQMGLLDEIDTFVDTLDVIREVWREHDIDIQVPYKWQDPEVMRSIKQEVINRLPYLRSDYKDAWPVTFYLKRALKNHLPLNLKPAPIPSDPDGPYKFHGQLPSPRGDRRAPARVAHHNDTPGFYRMRSLSPIQPDNLLPLRKQWSRRERPSRAETPSRHSSPSSDSSSSSWSGSSDSSPSPPGSPPPRPQRTPSSSSSSAGTGSSRTLTEHPEPHATCPGPPVFDFGRRESHLSKSPPTMLSPEPILDLLLSFAVPPADAQRIVRLLASFGITDVRYLRMLARMRTSDGWLRGLRASGRLSEIEVLVLREMMARAGLSSVEY